MDHKRRKRKPHVWRNSDDTNWQLVEPTQAELDDKACPVVYLGSLYQVNGWDVPLTYPETQYLQDEAFFMVTKIKVVHRQENLNQTVINIRAFCDEKEIEFSISALVWKRFMKKVA